MLNFSSSGDEGINMLNTGSIPLTLFVCTLGLALGTGVSIAQSSPRTVSVNKQPHYSFVFEKRFKKMDTDGDGTLSRSEAEHSHMRNLIENFDRLDTNRDGKITREELHAFIQGKLSS